MAGVAADESDAVDKTAKNVIKKYTLLLFVTQARDLSIPWEMKKVQFYNHMCCHMAYIRASV